MISAPIEASTLEEYYNKLYKLQSDAHKPDYMLVHDEIKSRLGECESYTEFGINQGATLAAAMLENPSKVRAYDIKLGWYTRARTLFDEYANEHSIDLEVTESNTLECKITPVDLLYVDTLHRYDHLQKELKIHAGKVQKYIVCHDTAAQRGLQRAIDEFVHRHREWKVVKHCQINVGFTTIKRN